MDMVFSENFASLKPSAIREMLKYSSEPGFIALSAGNPSPEAFPKEDLARIAGEVLREHALEVLQYGVTEGYAPLRAYLKGYLRDKYSVGGGDDEVIVTAGAQQVMDLVCRVLCNRGDVVVCEEPSFVGALNAFRSLGARLVGVPMCEDGMDIDALERVLKREDRAKLIYTIPNFQNPTGATMSMQKRKALYELASRYNVVILEDNPYGDLRYGGEDIPAIKTLDRDGRVVYSGSFSKVISPGLRVGYALAPAAAVAKMAVAKQTEDVHSPLLNQMICYAFMTECDFEGHLDALRSLYRGKLKTCLALIEQHLAPLGVTCFKTDGGLFCWCRLPDGVDMQSFCERAVREHRVAVVPGTAFSVDEDARSSSFRVNFSTPTDEALREGIRLLGATLESML